MHVKLLLAARATKVIRLASIFGNVLSLAWFHGHSAYRIDRFQPVLFAVHGFVLLDTSRLRLPYLDDFSENA
jgi:hypothetical protein